MSLKKVLLLSFIGLVVIALIFTLTFFFVLNSKGDSKKDKVEHFQFELDEIYTNIKKSNNIMKVNMTIEYTDRNLTEVLEEQKARIRNDILELLRNKTLEELSGKEGQQKARTDIKDKIVEIVESNNILNVYFTEFIVQ
ncbi:flagellar basal body-associated FliL family protein [Maledivibacter halophilus]|uniref:Flagellar protein FliL n=1 Tax=Maledivibacter halophilus TaxID=36842 RepID=A0A1T5LFC3_9FIRM|nr:flagellar basal body-associated FliL family protein [Maledivibacter halophilus]SKC74369.1 flagellar FliL protein [Maledivibacter halophilus]